MTESCPHCEEEFEGKFAEKSLKAHKREMHEMNFSDDVYYIQ